MPRFIKDIDLGTGSAGSVNSEGLPNQGIDYYISAEVVAAMAAAGKPYIVSISGLSLTDNLEMLGRVMATEGVDAIELNLACPNIPGKPVIAYGTVVTYSMSVLAFHQYLSSVP
jgi:dihydroorotate dehydrogenase (fumarate)